MNNVVREMAELEEIGGKVLPARRSLPQFRGVPFIDAVPGRRVDNDPLEGKAFPNYFNHRHKVRVAADENQPVRQVAICVVHHLHSDSYVGSLFFRLGEEAITSQCAARMGAVDLLFFKLAHDDIYRWQRAQRANVRVLPNLGDPRDDGCEEADMADVVVFSKATTKFGQIQPLVRGALDGSVVEIEAVNVDDGAVGWSGQKNGRSLSNRPPAPLEGRGVVSEC
jgi:hypothetical protein